VGPRIVSRLREETLLPSDIVTMADQYAPDAPLFALTLEELEPLRRYFEELRHVRLDVAGAELAELGLGESPRVGEILAELRRRKLDGELDGRDAELAAARELIERA
jgi:tRNA nucleotidyltransferase (CCA-adding enzyme)